MPQDERRQRPPQGRDIEPAGARRHGHVVGAPLGRQPVDEPERLLAERQGLLPQLHAAGPQGRSFGGALSFQPRQQRCGQLGSPRPLQEIGQRQRHAEGGLDRGFELDGRQRIEAQRGQRSLRIERRRRHAHGRRGPLAQEPLDGRLALRRLQGRQRFPGRHERSIRRFGRCSQGAPADHLQLAGQVQRPGGAALDLAGGRLGHRAHAHEDHVVCLHLVLLGDRAAHRLDDFFESFPPPPLHLLHDDQPLLAGHLDRERGAAARAQVGMAALGGQLDVLRIVVAPRG